MTVQSDDDLEKTIADLIERKRAAPKGSAAYRLAVRELAGLRYSYEMAGPIMEDLDPFEWGAMLPNPDVDPGTPTGKVLPMHAAAGWRDFSRKHVFRTVE